MSIKIGTYQGQPIRIIEDCIPDMKEQIIKNEYRTTDNALISNESYSSSRKRKQYHSELGDFSINHLNQIKYNRNKLVNNSKSSSCISTPYEKYWFIEGHNMPRG